MRSKVVVYNNIFFALSQTFIHQQVKLAKEYYDVSLLGHTVKNLEHFQLDDVDVTAIEQEEPLYARTIDKIKRRIGIPVSLGQNTSRKVEAYLQQKKPDLVHAHFGFNAVKILPVVKALRIPMTVTFHGYDASPMIFEKPAYFKALPELLEYCSKIIVVSEHMRDVLPLTAAQMRKVVVFPCPVDDTYFSPIATKSMPGRIGILHSGRIVSKKGVPDLVQVFNDISKIHPQARLDVIGDGDEVAQVADLVKHLALEEKVRLHGSQPVQVVKEFMGECDIFVLNSRTSESGDMEGSPVTLLEAMSMGKAVVSTTHAGIPNIIEDGKNGLLVEERDNDALCNAIRRLIEEPRLRYKLGQNARETVEENFSIKVRSQDLIKVYRSIIEPQKNLAHSY